MPCDLQVANENVPFWGKYSSYIKDFIMKLILPEYLEPVPVAVSWAAWSAAWSSWISLVLPLASYSVPVLNIEGTFPSGLTSSAVANSQRKCKHTQTCTVYTVYKCAPKRPRDKNYSTPPRQPRCKLNEIRRLETLNVWRARFKNEKFTIKFLYFQNLLQV